MEGLSPIPPPLQGNRALLTDPRPEAMPVSPPWTTLKWPPDNVKRPSALDIPPIDPDDALPDGIDIGYWPVWNGQTEQIDTYLSEPIKHDGPPGSTLVPASLHLAGAAATANLDFAMLFACLQQIESNIEQRRPLAMIVPLHHSTLLAPHLETVLAILRYFPDPARARYLFLEVIDCPEQSPPAPLAAAAQRLRAACRDLLFRIGPKGPGLHALAACRPIAIGARLGRLPPHRLPLLAAKLGISRTYAWAVDDPIHRGPAVAQGHWLISGHALRPIGPAPREIEVVPRQAMIP